MDVFKVNKRIKFSIYRKRMVISIIVSIAVGYFSKHSLGFDNKEAIAIMAATLVAMTMLYHSANLEKIELDKKIAALNIITEWYKDFSEKSRSLKECRKRYEAERLNDEGSGKKTDINTLVETEHDSNGIKYVFSLMPILNYFEKISIAIKYKAVDEDIIKDYFYDLFTMYHDTFITIIIDRRVQIKGLPSAFINYCEIVNRWIDEKNK